MIVHCSFIFRVFGSNVQYYCRPVALHPSHSFKRFSFRFRMRAMRSMESIKQNVYNNDLSLNVLLSIFEILKCEYFHLIAKFLFRSFTFSSVFFFIFFFFLFSTVYLSLLLIIIERTQMVMRI